LGAAFLAFWLCGWVVGEGFALFMLGAGATALVNGVPVSGKQPLMLGPALVIGSFLLLWLSFWTFGGIMAMRELLHSLWAKDRLAISPDGLMVRRQLGPFVSRRSLARGEIRRIYVRPHLARLVAETEKSVITLTDLGTPQERAEAANLMHGMLHIPQEDDTSVPPSLPDNWEEVSLPHGGSALVSSSKTRRRQAGVMSAITLTACGITLLLFAESFQSANLWGLTVGGAVVSAGLAWAALWLRQGRKEWRIDPGELTRQRRFGSRVTVLGKARDLELTERQDSDGDPWYELHAVGEEASVQLADHSAFHGAGSRIPRPRRFSITCVVLDPTEPRRLGLWLSQRACIPLVDRIGFPPARSGIPHW
jgi:hypothetical protein